MPRLPLLLLASLALALAACGGGDSGSGSATGTASSAAIVPADAVAFISVNTDRDSGQWDSADALLKKFPIRSQLLAQVNEGLSDDSVDFRRDVVPVLGPTFDIAVLGVSGGEPQFVGIARPTDEARFTELLEEGDDPAVHTEIDGWTVFSDTQASLDAVSAAGDKLADEDAFVEAMGELPEEANAKAFVSGAELFSVLEQELPQLRGQVETGDLEWLSFALSSHDEGWKLDGALKSSQNTDVAVFSPSLIERVPSGSLFVMTFKGGQAGLDQLRKNPQFSQQSAQLEQLLGVTFDDLARLLEGETVVYVREGSPFPEATLVTKPADPQRALRTIDRAANTLAGFAGGASPTRTQIEGVDARKLALGNGVSLYWGVQDDLLIATISPAGFREGGGDSLEDDPVFSAAVDAAGMPDETSGFVYVNLEDGIPVLEGFAEAAGDPLPPDVAQNVEPLRSFLGYGTAGGELGKFSALLHVR